MLNKKPKEDNESQIERHVDDMMDIKRPDPQPLSRPSEYKSRPVLPPIDIFSDPSTAPQVSPEVAEKMKVEPTQSDAEPQLEAVETETSDGVLPTDSPDDPALDKAIDEIVKEETDSILEPEDGEVAADDKQPAAHQNIFNRLLHGWWHHKTARYGSLAVVILALIIIAILPTTRYGALNLVGIRATASLQVLDDTNKLPLKNVQVKVGNMQALTDKTGSVTLTHLKLGKQVLQINRVAFKPVSETVNLGLGQNKLSQVALVASGDQYHFKLVDFLSGKALNVGAEVSSGQASAMVASDGQAILTVSGNMASNFTAQVTADDYRTENVTVTVGSSAVIPVRMVPATKSVFISKASGTYDVYKIDADGLHRQLLLAGTGRETANISLVPNNTGNEVALVSTRDDVRNSDGYLLQALTLINVDNGKALSIDHSEQIQIVGWSGSTIIYVRIKAGASAGNPERYQLMSYDYDTSLRLELAHANGFNDMVYAKGSIYYAASNNFQGGISYLGKINADNTGKQTLVNEEVMNIFRPTYSTLNFSALKDWYSYTLGSSSATKLTAAPSSGTKNLTFIDSPDGHNAAWVENRDGKGTLLVHGVLSGVDNVVTAVTGLTYPVRWLSNNTLVYRVASPQETADYVVNIDGGNPQKITDVTNAAGLSSWYYY